MLLAPELGDGDMFWGMHCLKKHHFLWKKEGERVEKLLPVEFAAWLEVAGGCGGLSPSQLRAVALPRLPVGKGQKTVPGYKKSPLALEEKHLGGEIHPKSPAPRGAGWASGQIQGSWRSHIPQKGDRGCCGELGRFRKLLFFPSRFFQGFSFPADLPSAKQSLPNPPHTTQKKSFPSADVPVPLELTDGFGTEPPTDEGTRGGTPSPGRGFGGLWGGPSDAEGTVSALGGPGPARVYSGTLN